MNYRFILNDSTKYQGDVNDLYDFVGSLSPDNYQIIQSLANAATIKTEKYLGAPIGKRSFTYVISRGETDLNDNYVSKTMLSSCYFNITSNWIQLYTPVDSITQISLGVWGGDDIVLTENIDYVIDLDNYYPRIVLSATLQITDFFNKFKNIKIDCVGGLHDEDGNIYSNIDIAIKLMTKALFEDRGTESKDYNTNGYAYLLEDYKVSSLSGGR